MTHPQAGQPAPASALADIPSLVAAYYESTPDPHSPSERVSFGTSGHRGTSLDGSFNRAHIAATAQATAEYRAAQGISGPLYIGLDSHALSLPAFYTALRVLVANGVQVRAHLVGDVLRGGRVELTPTPLVSRAILAHNRQGHADAQADGIVITPSHNPPTDGGFKYNPPSGGPAPTEATSWIEGRANELLAGAQGVQEVGLEEALARAEAFDFITPYVSALGDVIDMAAIQAAGVRIGVDPLGGSSLPVWQAIAAHWGLELEVLNTQIDPRFAFMTLDKDGAIRMDCSSPYAMAGLLQHAARFDVAIGNDPDADRHGIVADGALMNPNHYLAVMTHYLFQNRPEWPKDAKVGKTAVSSALIDRVAAGIGREVYEVPVGFKYFVDGLLSGSLGFGGEESAGASFLDMQGAPWSTDKDGIIAGLLAAEITAVTGKNPAAYFAALTEQYGSTAYTRRDAPATPAQKSALKALSAGDVTATILAGDPITARLTHAPGDGAALGGLKVTTDEAWFAARPSGTEDIYKIYAESFRGAEHLAQVLDEAELVVASVISAQQ